MSNTSDRIEELRTEYGKRVLILGHHYQRSAVLRHADEIGDSLELARAAARSDAEKVVFCGVRFMAESADILTDEGQTVYMPETLAGCPMAGMARLKETEAAWRLLGGEREAWLPVVYVNSTASIKAFCGRHGGTTCTSSNAERIFRWAFSNNRRILFLPDEHLGVNTAADLGLDDAEVAVYDPRETDGGLDPGQLDKVRLVVWKGYCLVHTAFTVGQIEEMRRVLPEARVIVHPEVPHEVVRRADAHGSTSQIIRYVEESPEGSTIVIGTELNLVQRLAEAHKGRVRIVALRPSVCANMARTNEENLLDVLERWAPRQEIHVAPGVRKDARLALERMLDV